MCEVAYANRPVAQLNGRGGKTATIDNDNGVIVRSISVPVRAVGDLLI
jgi:hypothetical protein